MDGAVGSASSAKTEAAFQKENSRKRHRPRLEELPVVITSTKPNQTRRNPAAPGPAEEEQEAGRYKPHTHNPTMHQQLQPCTNSHNTGCPRHNKSFLWLFIAVAPAER